MTPAKYDITIYRGDTFRLALRAFTKNADGSKEYLDLTGYSVKAQFRQRERDPNVVLEFAGEVSDQGTTKGGFVISASAADTQAIDVSIDGGVWDCQLTSSGGEVYTYLRGNVSVQGDVTR